MGTLRLSVASAQPAQSTSSVKVIVVAKSTLVGPWVRWSGERTVVVQVGSGEIGPPGLKLRVLAVVVGEMGMMGPPGLNERGVAVVSSKTGPGPPMTSVGVGMAMGGETGPGPYSRAPSWAAGAAMLRGCQCYRSQCERIAIIPRVEQW